MKAFLILVARLLFVAVYSISMGLLTGWIWMKIVESTQKRAMKRAMRHYDRPAAA